ncbi:protein PHOSPHATE-INDUCED 1-like [Lolium rigidum]|jgi:hypothetical protein|uniref:protein PHOSPHATE-INDUCED 1-like n=1 Tax=Lolium rigidum TaxID=89674 RepID=UPI001F5DC804|nr:protein PHOSPHATE-INDUCED 1-like [Lolium rigidum]
MAVVRATPVVLLAAVMLASTAQLCMGARRRMELYRPDPADMLSFHNGGAVLHGDIPVSILWYGKFSAAQKSVIVDFLLSLTAETKAAAAAPSVAQWWSTIDQQYLSPVASTSSNGAGKKTTRVLLASQLSDGADGAGSMGNSLTLEQIASLAATTKPQKGGIAVVFTAEDVAVEGFGMGRCSLHGSDAGAGTAYIWVGNPATQCPGQCAWPFHQPAYGPQDPPLVAPNGDVGVDGMVMNLASMLAGAVTNPFGDAYYQGSSDAPLEACTACTGKFGSGSYPGYAGDLKVDSATGASYNANGARGRKYLLPALFDISTSACSTLV